MPKSFRFPSGWRIAEANQIFQNMSADKGLVILNGNNEVVAVFDKEGNLWVKGFIAGLHQFRPPDVNTDTGEMTDGKKDSKQFN